jgi:hypothetical protein
MNYSVATIFRLIKAWFFNGKTIVSLIVYMPRLIIPYLNTCITMERKKAGIIMDTITETRH